MPGDNGEILVIRPLTKKTAKGELYRRRPEVEEQLETAVRMPFDVVADRLTLPGKDTPGYLYDETLVYLLREAHRRDDPAMEDLIYDNLAGRVEMLLRKINYQVGPDDRDDFAQEIHIKVIRKIFDLDSDAADYAQVMFGDFVTTLAYSDLKKYRNARKKETGIVEIDAHKEDNYDYDPPAETLSQETLATLHDALDQLNERTRTALILHHIDGLQIESNDPDEPTVSRYFGVTGRTIRNWFGGAVRTLTEANGVKE